MFTPSQQMVNVLGMCTGCCCTQFQLDRTDSWLHLQQPLLAMDKAPRIANGTPQNNAPLELTGDSPIKRVEKEGGERGPSYPPPPVFPLPEENIKRLTIGMIQCHYRKKGELLVGRKDGKIHCQI